MKKFLTMLLLTLVAATISCNFQSVTSPETKPTAEDPFQDQLESPTDVPLATDAPLPTPTSEPDVSFQGITFSYDPSLAEHVNAEIIPASGVEEIAFWAILPEHIQFTFVEYVDADTFHEPRIYVYPVEEFKALNENAGPLFEELEQLLAEKPTEGLDDIPFLPVWNAAQMISTNITYFDFQNGSGVRFLTQYGQALWPINNHEIFYTYQGMTNNGEFYLAAVFPVSHPELPDTGEEIINGDFDAFFENYEPYMVEVTDLLNTQDPSSFIPDVNILDELVRSIHVIVP